MQAAIDALRAEALSFTRAAQSLQDLPVRSRRPRGLIERVSIRLARAQPAVREPARSRCARHCRRLRHRSSLRRAVRHDRAARSELRWRDDRQRMQRSSVLAAGGESRCAATRRVLQWAMRSSTARGSLRPQPQERATGSDRCSMRAAAMHATTTTDAVGRPSDDGERPVSLVFQFATPTPRRAQRAASAIRTTAATSIRSRSAACRPKARCASASTKFIGTFADGEQYVAAGAAAISSRNRVR